MSYLSWLCNYLGGALEQKETICSRNRENKRNGNKRSSFVPVSFLHTAHEGLAEGGRKWRGGCWRGLSRGVKAEAPGARRCEARRRLFDDCYAQRKKEDVSRRASGGAEAPETKLPRQPLRRLQAAKALMTSFLLNS